MDREEIYEFLNPNNDSKVKFYIDAAISHIQSKTHRSFEDGDGKLLLPFDLVKAVEMLVESAENPTNVQSESVGGELSTSYFSVDATLSVVEYWRPYRKLAW